MKHLAVTLALVLLPSALAATPPRLTVWIPEQGQTATLSAVGLVGAAGNRLVLNQSEYTLPVERPIAGGFARLVNTTKGVPTRLEIVQRGKVTASRAFPEAVYSTFLRGTQRGPCLSYTPDGTQAAILLTGLKNGHADYSKLTAYIYRLSDSKLLNSFAVKP